jgi:hypothetical protein
MTLYNNFYLFIFIYYFVSSLNDVNIYNDISQCTITAGKYWSQKYIHFCTAVEISNIFLSMFRISKMLILPKKELVCGKGGSMLTK